MKLRILKGQAGQKLAAENRKDFPGRMLGSHVENAGIKAPQARAGSSRSGGRGGARDLSRLVGTRVGLRPRHLSAAARRAGCFPAPSEYARGAGHRCKGSRRHSKNRGKLVTLILIIYY